MKKIILLFIVALTSGCSSLGGLRTDLSADTIPTPTTEKALTNNLLRAFDTSGSPELVSFRKNPSVEDVKDYIRSGFTLTDIYCDAFFRRTNLSYRKRKFGRGATNDVGTVISAVLGLSNAGPHVVAGIATGFGLADSTWRNYDESFVVSPELDVVRSLVLSAQDEFRRSTLDNMPTDYMTARSAVIRYAGLCSFLGMQALLNQSVDQQRRQLQDAAKIRSVPAPAIPAVMPPAISAAPDAVAGSVPK